MRNALLVLAVSLQQGLANSLWGLAKLGSANEEVVHAGMQALLRILPTCTPQELGNMIWAFGTTMTPGRLSNAWGAGRACQPCACLHTHACIHTHLVHCLLMPACTQPRPARTAQPATRALAASVAAHILKPATMQAAVPQNCGCAMRTAHASPNALQLVPVPPCNPPTSSTVHHQTPAGANILWGMAALEVHNPVLFDTALERLSELGATLTPIDVASALWAAAMVDHRADAVVNALFATAAHMLSSPVWECRSVTSLLWAWAVLIAPSPGVNPLLQRATCPCPPERVLDLRFSPALQLQRALCTVLCLPVLRRWLQ